VDQAIAVLSLRPCEDKCAQVQESVEPSSRSLVGTRDKAVLDPQEQLLIAREQHGQVKIQNRIMFKPEAHTCDRRSLRSLRPSDLGLPEAGTGGEVLVAEKEVSCYFKELADQNDGYEVITSVPGTGTIVREAALTSYLDSKDPYLNGIFIQAYDIHIPEDPSEGDTWNDLVEIVTTEGGVWKGTGQTQLPTYQGIFVGEGKYIGLMMNFNGVSSKCKYRITELPE